MKIKKFIFISVFILAFIALFVGVFNFSKGSPNSSGPSDDVVVVPDDAPTDDVSGASGRYYLTADDFQWGFISYDSSYWLFSTQINQFVVSRSALPINGLELNVKNNSTSRFFLLFLDSNNLVIGEAYYFTQSVNSSSFPTGAERAFVFVEPIDDNPDYLYPSYIPYYIEGLTVSYSLS